MKNAFLKSIFSPLKMFFALTVLTIALSGCGNDDEAPPQVTKVDIVSMTPSSPAELKYYKTDPNDRVQITFDYNVVEPDGARIFIEPVSNSGGEGTAYYSPSPVYKGSGSKTVMVSIYSNQPSMLIDQIMITIKSPDQSVVISETFVDVSYTFTSNVNTFTFDGETYALASGFGSREEEIDGGYPWLIVLTSEGINYEEDDFVGTGEIIIFGIIADADYYDLPSGSYSSGDGNATGLGVGVDINLSGSDDLIEDFDDISVTISGSLIEIGLTINFTLELTDGRVVTGSYKGVLKALGN